MMTAMMPQAFLIEPQSLFVPFLRELIGDSGYNVVGVSHRLELSRLIASGPEAVVIDIDFADDRELALVREAREHLPAATIVVMTDRRDPVFLASCRLAGATLILSKHAEPGTARKILRGTLPA